MLATIRDDTWNVFNMLYITPNSKKWDYSDIPSGGHKRFMVPPTWLKMATTLEKHPTPTHFALEENAFNLKFHWRTVWTISEDYVHLA